MEQSAGNVTPRVLIIITDIAFWGAIRVYALLGMLQILP
jgi:hypothetical protein